MMATEERRFGPHVGIAVLEPGEESVWARNRGILSVLATVPAILAAVVMIALLAGADSTLLVAMWKWTPFMAEGFVLNVGMSLFAIIVGTVGGVFLGMGQVSPSALTAAPSRIATQIFRNAPWLVLLFYCIFLVPFQVTVGGETFQIPNWLRASIGFTIPVIANFSEVVRGAVQSIPSGQWEAARSLGYKWSKTMFSIVLPQCIKRMIPPWMNLYAVLLMATPLASIVGVEEAMTNTRTALQAEANSNLLLPMYAYLLTWFFFYCYPIARFSMYLESRFAVR
jgi:polar amino acid transport system permease protein